MIMEEKSFTSRCHGSKISGRQQSGKRHLKVNLHCFKLIDLIQFHLLWKILAILSGVESEIKENSCAVFTDSIERAREIRKFQVADLQRRLKNAQKSMMHMQSCSLRSRRRKG